MRPTKGLKRAATSGYSVEGFVMETKPLDLWTVRGPEDVLRATKELKKSKREHFCVLLLNAGTS